jgi:hypothetical protein
VAGKREAGGGREEKQIEKGQRKERNMRGREKLESGQGKGGRPVGCGRLTRFL